MMIRQILRIGSVSCSAGCCAGIVACEHVENYIKKWSNKFSYKCGIFQLAALLCIWRVGFAGVTANFPCPCSSDSYLLSPACSPTFPFSPHTLLHSSWVPKQDSDMGPSTCIGIAERIKSEFWAIVAEQLLLPRAEEQLMLGMAVFQTVS